MTSLGEMSTLLPISGSFETYATRFVDPALGFALGWNYWFCWAITVAAELVAVDLLLNFGFQIQLERRLEHMFPCYFNLLNMLSAKAYGESEYWFASIKVVTIIIFLIVGVLMIVGIMGGNSPGFSNWVLSDGNGNKGPFIGG